MKHLNFRALVPNYISLVSVQWRQWRHCEHMIISEPILFEPQVVRPCKVSHNKSGEIDLAKDT